MVKNHSLSSLNLILKTSRFLHFCSQSSCSFFPPYIQFSCFSPHRMCLINSHFRSIFVQQNAWNGELSPAARNILLQHAIQGDVSDLQQATVKWVAYSRIPSIDPKILLGHFSNLEALWGTEALSRDEVSDFYSLLICLKMGQFLEQRRQNTNSLYSFPTFPGRMYRRID